MFSMAADRAEFVRAGDVIRYELRPQRMMRPITLSVHGNAPGRFVVDAIFVGVVPEVTMGSVPAEAFTPSSFSPRIQMCDAPEDTLISVVLRCVMSALPLRPSGLRRGTHRARAWAIGAGRWMSRPLPVPQVGIVVDVLS